MEIGDLVRVTYRFDPAFYVVTKKVDDNFYKLVDIDTHLHSIEATPNCAVCDEVLHKAFNHKIQEVLEKIT